MLDRLTIDDFSGRMGERFTATAGGTHTLNLTLTSVDALQGPPGAGRAPFSLEFRDDAQDHVPQQTVAMEHPELGAFELFLVPLGPEAGGMRYEAIFT